MPASSSRSRPAPQAAAAAADDVDPNEMVQHDATNVESEDLDTKPSAAAEVTSRPSVQQAVVSSASPGAGGLLVTAISWEVQISIYTYLRAADLSALQRVSRHFANRRLINAVIRHTAQHVYPPSLTVGFDTPEIGGPVNTQTNEGGADVLTYEMLRNMEMLVVARVLSRPEPLLRDRMCSDETADGAEDGDGGGGKQFYYVSKAWCRTALRWLEVQQEEQREAAKQQSSSTTSIASSAAASSSSSSRNPHASSKKKKKPSRKDRRQQRLRDRKRSDATPPWGNINHDLVCPHGDLARCSTKSARARRRIMDKQAWRVLNRLYPDSVPLSCNAASGNGSSGGLLGVGQSGECVQCLMEQEAEKKNESDRRERAKEERKRPLSCPVVRGIYTRGKGVPASCLAHQNAEEEGDDNNKHNDKDLDLDRKPAAAAIVTLAKTTPKCQCPLVPGVYNALPRSWCHRWRKFLKSGEGERPVAPDATALLCDAHRLPLVPPHLEAYLYGDTPTLLVGSGNSALPYFADDADAPLLTGPVTPTTSSSSSTAASSPFSATPVGYNPVQSPSTEEDHADAIYGSQAAASVSGAGEAEMEEEEEEAIIVALRAAGLSEAELNAQRLAMQNHERQSHMAAATASHHASASSPVVHSSPSGSFRRQSSVATINTPIIPGNAPNAGGGGDGTTTSSTSTRESINEQLDRENYRVVEILTDEEFTALEKWWPDISVNYALRFAVTEKDDDGTGTGRGRGTTVVWSTPPCRECDSSGKNCQEFAGRMQRARRIRRAGHVPNGKGR